jgi:hypothetical protein
MKKVARLRHCRFFPGAWGAGRLSRTTAYEWPLCARSGRSGSFRPLQITLYSRALWPRDHPAAIPQGYPVELTSNAGVLAPLMYRRTERTFCGDPQATFDIQITL